MPWNSTGRDLVVLGASLIALSACTTAALKSAPPDPITSVHACSAVLENPCTIPNGGRPSRPIAFPTIREWSSLKITLERTRCFGPCPIYTVTIAGDGTVTWHGEEYVKVTGDAVARIAPERVRQLFEAFRNAEFFWLFDEYSAIETADEPSHVTTIAFDGYTKTVGDYAGRDIGMPEIVDALEDAIDEAANTAQWIGPGDHF